MLFADDAALTAHTEEALKRLVNSFAQASVSRRLTSWAKMSTALQASLSATILLSIRHFTRDTYMKYAQFVAQRAREHTKDLLVKSRKAVFTYYETNLDRHPEEAGIIDLDFYFRRGITRRVHTSEEEMRNDIMSLYEFCSSTDNNPKHHLCPKSSDSWCFY
ncbi:hypothetical protein Pmani_014599 [Petrolisthes manimaculis]|uniref:Uncharacterized protein n=1 Tax=Petrolisthes manimaculis TaxID=1843537 RepID=A0AAE1PV61_9EUCA|nr:hypothetical protein Pmani_014599 [Petrolisthes manimaculis]